MSNGRSTHKKSSRPESKTATLTMHPSSPIYLPLGVNSLQEWLTSLQQDSPVSPTQSQGCDNRLSTIGISGLKRSELSVKWLPDLSCWKTFQVSFLAQLMNEPQHTGELWLESLPKSGTVSIGEQSGLTMWAHPTVESDGGVSGWPTPRAREGNAGDVGSIGSRHNAQRGYLDGIVQENWPTPDATPRGRRQGANRGFGADLNDAVYTWPTPSTMDHIERQGMRPSWAATNRTTGYLSEAIVQQGEAWATPRVSGQEGYETRATRKGHDIAMSYLESQAEYITENWPTPRKVDWKGSGPTVIRKDGKSRMDKLVYLAEQSQHGPLAQVTQTHGSESSESDQTSPQPSPKRLNPSFVEWLMGVPIGWTSLKPLEMESYLRWWHCFSGDYSDVQA